MKTDKINISELKIIEPYLYNQRLRERAQYLRMKKHGIQQKTIAKVLEVRPETLSAWGKKYDLEGLGGLMEWRYRGRRPRLSEEEFRRIQERNKERPFSNVEELQEFIQEKFGIRYHLHWVQKLIKHNLNRDMVK